jgi:hypothetical protein
MIPVLRGAIWSPCVKVPWDWLVISQRFSVISEIPSIIGVVWVVVHIPIDEI